MKAMKTLLAGSFVALAAPAFAAETPATLTDAQRDEVRALVKEVLADADSRASLASGATAGIGNDGKVFLRSEDDRFGMNLGGMVQFRWGWHNDHGMASEDEGFDLRRVRVDLQGHLGSDASNRVDYRVLVGTGAFGNPLDSTVRVIEAYGDYVFAEGWSARGGLFTLPYSRERLISAASQVAVERSGTDIFFGLGRGEGVQLEYRNDTLRTRGAVTDGANSNVTPVYADGVNFAASGRAELLIAGNGKTGMDDFNDNFAARGSSEVNGLLLGGGAYYEEPNSASAFYSGLQVEHSYGATADATFKIANLAFYGAGYVAYNRLEGNTGYKSPTPWGVIAQADVAVTNQVDVFGQWNFVDNNTAAASELLQSITAGANYHINSHVRLTGDVVWVYDGNGTFASPAPRGGSVVGYGSGVVSGAKDEVAVRVQLQVNF